MTSRLEPATGREGELDPEGATDRQPDTSASPRTPAPEPEGWRPRLVVSDLDGTFLSPDGTVSDLNRQAVADALAAGIEVVFATGRPIRWLQVVADLGLPNSVVVASNGAMLYDVARDEVLSSSPIEPEVLAAVVRDIAEAVPGSRFATEQGATFNVGEGYHLRGDGAGDVRRLPAAELVAVPGAVKLLVQQPDLDPDELSARVRPVVGERLTVTHSAADGTGLLELSAPGVTKASALAHWCAGRGITPDEVAAFGDMPNDRAMLSWAGRPHVMAEAHPSLSDLRATVIGSNADSAVGRTLRGWL
ncbi:HAD family phosphatase [Desertihabitans brevis]|uniref:HAD family phosphatase n=1 Tax=Desertihabitans brevis TaxID=2268447 RepID=A0A367YWT9_9ACTN|nr:HAD family hydrolase [Desertihabitans brevis]RCK69411.1 HAD family phosphatase [Desertihabitans brevis]